MPRVDSAAFSNANSSLNKYPLFVVELAFDSAATDLHYFTSNKRAALPSTATNIYHGHLRDVSGTSQTLDPIRFQSTIGTINFEIIDVAGAITTLLNTKLTAGYGTRHKRVRVYVGYDNLAWSDYALVTTQLVENRTYKDGLYTFSCIDVQRLIRDSIFDLYDTRLQATVTFGAINIPGASTAEVANFDTLEHTGSYSDAPNETVGYIRIKDEIIRWKTKSSNNFVVDNENTTPSSSITSGDTTISLTDASAFPNGGATAFGIIIEGATQSTIRWSGKSGNDLTNVTGVDNSFTTGATVYWAKGRGVLGSVAQTHEADATADIDQRPRIDEYVYLEIPVVKLIYGLLMGQLYDPSTPIDLPANWHLGVSTSYISTTHFLAMEYAGIWNPADDTDNNNVMCRFLGEKKQDGKKFIDTQLLPLIGAFMPILNDGQLGLKLTPSILSRSGYVDVLTNERGRANVAEYSDLLHDDADVHNVFDIKWNTHSTTGKTTRRNVLIDSTSVATHGSATPLEFSLRGLHGSRHTTEYLYTLLNFLRDRHAGPPKRLTLKCLHKINNLSVGDSARVKLDCVRDYANTATGNTLNQTMQIIGKQVDWVTGGVTLNLMGSSQQASALTDYTTSADVMDPSFWTGTGKPLDGSDTSPATPPGGITVNESGGVLHITGSGTLTGNADVTNSAAVYYSNIDVEIDAGVLVTITNNVQLRINGNLHIVGGLTGKGQGLAGAGAGDFSAGTQGAFGTTKAGGALDHTARGYIKPSTGFTATKYQLDSFEATPLLSKTGLDAPAALNLVNSSGTSLAGIPADLRGTSGGSGGNADHYQHYAYHSTIGTGGAGGAGGAGLLVVCKSLSFGGSGYIDLSGADGSAGGSGTTPLGGHVVQAGSGAGGFPGGLYVLLASDVGFATDLDTKFIADIGDSPVVSQPLPDPYRLTANPDAKLPAYQSYHIGYPTEDMSDGGSGRHPMYRVIYIPDDGTQGEDVSEFTGVPTAITIQQALNTRNTLNVATLEISVTPPSDGNYSRSEISIAPLDSDTWTVLGEVTSTNEVLAFVPADGASYNVRAVPISTEGVRSETAIEKVYTVTSALQARFASGSKIFMGDDNPATNGGMILSDSGIQAYNSTPALTFDIDAATGDAYFKGELAATTGHVGGWYLSSSGFQSIGGEIVMDSNVPSIYLEDFGGTNYIQIDPTNGMVGVDSVLGTVFHIPVNGDPPTFSSGVINETEFQIYTGTNGVIRTGANVGSGSPVGQGVIINDTGIKGFAAGNPTPVFTLSSTDGSLTCTDATLTGTFTISAGSGLANLSDANADSISETGSKKWAGETGADKIKDQNVELTTGYLKRGSDIRIDFNARNISIANQSIGSAGVQLGYYGSPATAQFYVGDGGAKGMHFDGTDITLGRDSKIKGADSFNGDDIILNGYFSHFQVDSSTLSGNWSYTRSDNYAVLSNISSDTSTNGEIEIYRPFDLDIATQTWNSDRGFKLKLRPDVNGTSSYLNIYTGAAGTGGQHFGFQFNGDGNIYAIYNDNVGSSNSTSLQTYTNLTNYLVYAVLDNSTSPRQVKFYVDGVLKLTQTSQLPSGTTDSDRIIKLYQNKATTGWARAFLGAFKFWQDS